MAAVFAHTTSNSSRYALQQLIAQYLEHGQYKGHVAMLLERYCLLVQGKTQFLQKKECCAGALEGRLIATLCRLTGAKTVLEVGMFTGTTTLAIAEAIPSDGKVQTFTEPKF